jgi:hypothetical protein
MPDGKKLVEQALKECGAGAAHDNPGCLSKFGVSLAPLPNAEACPVAGHSQTYYVPGGCAVAYGDHHGQPKRVTR